MAQNLRKRFIAVDYDMLATQFNNLKYFTMDSYTVAKRLSFFGQNIILKKDVVCSELLEGLYGDK